MAWKPGKLLHLIMIYVILSGITFWLPATRGLFDGSSYSCGFRPEFHGTEVVSL